jgi:hypothetical protein
LILKGPLLFQRSSTIIGSNALESAFLTVENTAAEIQYFYRQASVTVNGDGKRTRSC